MISKRMCRNEAIAWNVIEDKAVLLDRAEGRAIILNEVGSYIWRSLDTKMAASEIIALVSQHFNSGNIRIEKDIRFFLDELLRRDLIRMEEG
ncbi:MAG: hypothetical protein A2Y00_07270 [Omnitrophica WOR_2 bacterium GWF2_43_52]|nr:MAG: hypothetical protein A2062_07510 [Omnitrophica WOR_2 bacterium GWA2_44_7]OGX16665.1 MAG: hypothetical protein A2Y01_00945 [Omnitrophica WOR_2 bacterium GWC2_44_8]OGX20220.1 MAG: hypothetical protein A2Y00_07270 [Omnitrophica WOR_2 bacterium GWF2_43_52]OGX54482.1 MAG: hypothetical protein A2460_03135 [Omnitrophica WOR_2 bacterium RIFOXYC2_FULL_43_9]HAH20761.1 hypothetical protein [Candidatus Omnitrophota bacterium]